ncbi:MAG: Lrp/AsnC family transcriptional regulator [Eubacteriales bacterium]
MTDLLKLLENDARLSPESLARMLDKEVGDIKTMIENYENDGVILGYKTIIDWDKTDREYVSAFIEVKIAPKHDFGFDKVARVIGQYPEVQSVYLMSGAFDLVVLIEGKTLREVAFFVTHKLSTLEDVLSCSTHFVLRKYKDKGVEYKVPSTDERGEI